MWHYDFETTLQPLPMSLVVFLIYMSSSIFQICRELYSLILTTSTLQNHLHHLHLAVYIATCKKKGWMRYLQPQEIDGCQQLASLQPYAPFSPNVFLEVLVQWIVADDQVRHFLTPPQSLISVIQSIYIVEGCEFRNLLLCLWEGLEDKDIPHRTQIRTSIIRHFKEYYNVLKEKLVVSRFLIDLLVGVHFFCLQ